MQRKLEINCGISALSLKRASLSKTFLASVSQVHIIRNLEALKNSPLPYFLKAYSGIILSRLTSYGLHAVSIVIHIFSKSPFLS